MNNLEEFIRTNRAEFDSKEPREKLWSRIESDLDEGQTDFSWMWKAAVVVLLAVCGYLIWDRGQVPGEDSMVATEFYVDPEFVETELYYTQLISQKSLVVQQFDLEDAELKASFNRDIASLDTMYQELKQEFVETSNQAVLEAMIGNLQLRMELLNQQLLILEQISKDKNNETHQMEYL